MAVSMLLCMSMVAFADVTTTAVVTTYSGDNVTVRTDVTGAVNSEQVAFLVEKTTNEGTKIVWIDQTAAGTDGKASSTFTALAADAIDATVKVGTSSIAASASSTDSIEWGSYTVTWSAKDADGNDVASKVVAYVGDAEKSGTSTNVAQNDAKITFYVMAAANEELVSINDKTPTLAGNAFSVTIDAESEKDFDFVFASKTVAAEVQPSSEVNVANGVTTYNGEYASVTAKAIDATQYGILVALDKEDIVAVDTIDELNELAVNGGEGVSIIKLYAMGSNADNVFVIKIDDEKGNFFTGSKYWAAVYTANANGVDVSNPFELN